MTEHIWTASDWRPGIEWAHSLDEPHAAQVLQEHGIHAHHCGGYDVAAWPCPAAAEVLDRIQSARDSLAYGWSVGFQDACDRTPLGYAPNGPADEDNPYLKETP